jgi:protein STE50
MMIGKTMLCSFAMVLQVRAFLLREACFDNRGDSLGNRIERCLSYDEKPLLLFQKLKDASKNPVFMLKHIKDIRSPIAVAQQKQAARKASGDTSSSKSKSGASHARTPSRPPRLQVHPDTSAAVVPPPMTGTSNQPGWPEVMSPSLDGKDREDAADRERLKGTGGSEPPKSAVPNTATTTSTTDQNEIGTPAREVPVTADISYAVAIYPYMAEQEDEFDVIVYVLSFLSSNNLANHKQW